MQPPLLPQHDPDPEARRARLADACERYAYDHAALPPFALHAALPDAEELGLSSLAGRLATAAAAPANALAVRLRTLVDRFDELQDFEDLHAVVARPAIADRWRSDAAFAEQRLAGVEPRALRRIDALPDNLRVDDATFAAACGLSLAQARFDGRLFLADYALLDGLPGGGERDHSKFVYAPLALFVWRERPGTGRDAPPDRRGELVPVAIQRDQTPTAGNLYTPRDGQDWLLARLVVQSADAALGVLAHQFARVHLGMEAFALASARRLDEAHPLGRLLRAHLRHAIAGAERARRLLAPGGAIEALFGPTLAGTRELLRRSHAGWRVDAWSFARDLADRGVDDPELLPHYPYRDDGARICSALAEFVEHFLRWAYPEDADLAADLELRAWLDELADPAGGGLRGLPTTLDRAALVDLVTAAIFTVGPYHGAASGRLADYATYVPNMPWALYSPTPAARGCVDEAFLLDALPPQARALAQIELAAALANRRGDQLGHYAPDDLLGEPPELAELTCAFQERLVSIESEIERRNAARQAPYRGMTPSALRNGVGV